MKKNKNQKFTKLLLAIFLCTFFISSSRVYALPSLDEQIREIEQKINENKAAAQQKQSEANDLKSQISLMDKDISATQNNIDSLNKDIANSQKEIDRLVTEIKINEERIIKNKEDLKRLVQLLYEKGSLTSVEILASTRSITDFLNQEEYNRAIEEKINNTVTEVKALKNQLAIQKKDQENKKKQLENKKAELVAREHELSLQKSNKDNLLKQTQGEQAKYQKLVKELETQKKAVESSIWGGSGNYVSLGAIKAGDTVGYVGNSGYSTGCHLHFEIRTSSMVPVNPASYIGDGYFIHPVPSLVGYPGFGYSSGYFPGVFHTGIDYADGCRGTAVRASADGDIVKRVSGRPNTYPYSYEYGNYAMIKHTNNMYSFYGHLR